MYAYMKDTSETADSLLKNVIVTFVCIRNAGVMSMSNLL
jgi:hypothetical protein